MSQTEPLPTRPAARVHGGHKTEAIAHTSNEYGRFATRWRCTTCGRETGSLNVLQDPLKANPCPEPVLWVRMGCPGDGLFGCKECGAVYVDVYDSRPLSDRTCPACDSIETFRDDNPDTDPDEVIR